MGSSARSPVVASPSAAHIVKWAFPYTRCIALALSSHELVLSCTIHNESIHTYRSPSRLTSRITSWVVLGSLSHAFSKPPCWIWIMTLDLVVVYGISRIGRFPQT